MSTTTTFVGISDNQRLSSRVLKPPGGGSSIFFDDSENAGSKSTKVQAAPEKNEEQQSPNAEVNSESSPSVTREGDATNSANVVADKGADLNGAVAKVASCSTTPNSSKLDTKDRLFGEETRKQNANPRVRDHQRSTIFF
ncbi:jupiter microtubule associated homolog 1-like [Macrobrachium nipponense]|uniref:jupiter microtubule associated homolog 1-like n=1 Tax=Macrobrachium nipponense TaxID=159736 RepID=UPI0030C7FBBB